LNINFGITRELLIILESIDKLLFKDIKWKYWVKNVLILSSPFKEVNRYGRIFKSLRYGDSNGFFL